MKTTIQERRSYVDKAHETLSVVHQCLLLSIHRSGLYYTPAAESELNLELMRVIDEKHLKHPWLGVPKMTNWLIDDMNYHVNPKRIRRLFKLMGIQAICPKPNTSKRNKQHKVYPYLLKNLKIEHSNHVWAMDITYIPVKGGYLFLVAVIDLYSRFVLSWSLNNTMTSEWCRSVLEEAVEHYGKPEIVNTDQGSQFTAIEFSSYVVEYLGIKLSMDGKGRAIDNIFIERLWRSLKYEHVYLYPASDGLECRRGIENYFEYYNCERRHQGIDNHTPKTVYELYLKPAA